MAEFVPEKVHLVGSIGLDSVEEIFRTVGAMFGRRLRRVPDGEPGPGYRPGGFSRTRGVESRTQS